MNRPNPQDPDRMSAQERRAELSSLLATAMLRLIASECDHLSHKVRDSSLHFPRKQSGTATPTHRRPA